MKKKTRAEVKATRLQIIRALFPEGIKVERVWNEILGPLMSMGHAGKRLNLESLEKLFERKLKLKTRIGKSFPEVHDQLRIIFNADTSILQKITEKTWTFSGHVKPYSRHIILLHGTNPEEAILDWAAQSVISMLIQHIKKTL